MEHLVLMSRDDGSITALGTGSEKSNTMRTDGASLPCLLTGQQRHPPLAASHYQSTPIKQSSSQNGFGMVDYDLKFDTTCPRNTIHNTIPTSTNQIDARCKQQLNGFQRKLNVAWLEPVAPAPHQPGSTFG